MLSKSLLGPKWKHKDPKQRRKALLALDLNKKDSLGILEHCALNDSDSAVSQLALSRIEQLDLLLELKQKADPDHVGLVIDRISEYLIDPNANTLDIAAKMEVVALLQAPQVYDFIVLNAPDFSLREQALACIDSVASLEKLATQSDDPGLSRQAVDRLAQVSVLERVVKQSRRRDKQLSAYAQARIDTLVQQEKDRKQLQRKTRQLLEDIDSLVKACELGQAWSKYQTQFEQLEQQFSEHCVQLSQLGEDSADIEKTVRGLSDAYQKALQQQQQEQVLLDRQVADSTEQMAGLEAALSEGQGLLQQLKSVTDIDEHQLSELKTRVEAVEPSWKAQLFKIKGQSFPEPVAQRLSQMQVEFVRLNELLFEYYNDLTILLRASQELTGLAVKMDGLLTKTGSLTQKALSELSVYYKSLHLPRHYKVVEGLVHKVENSLSLLEDAFNNQKQNEKNKAETFVKLIEQLTHALETGKSAHAINLANRGKKLLGELSERDSARLNKDGSVNRFQACLAQLNELQAWRQWSSQPVLENLCQRVENLAEEVEKNIGNSDYNFNEAAQHISQARREWKKLTTAQTGIDPGLWEQFDQACNRAYEPCKSYFESQASQRKDNAKKRTVVCDDLERYYARLANQEWEKIDWESLNKIVRVAKQDWWKLGIVDRNEKMQLNQRFKKVLKKLQHLQRKYKADNRDKKELLIKRVQTAANSFQQDKLTLEQAMETVKACRAEWGNVGGASGEKDLWQQFQSAGDIIYEQLKGEREQQKRLHQEEESKREEIINRISGLASLEGDDFKSSQKECDQLKAQWAELPGLHKSTALERRFQSACKAYAKQSDSLLAMARKAAKQDLLRNMQLCTELESLLWRQLADFHEGELSAGLETINSRWQSQLDGVSGLNNSLRHRLEQLLSLGQSMATGQSSLVEQAFQQVDTTVADARKMCIKAEVLAGKESPAEDRQMRMEYQVSQLAQQMQQGDKQSGQTQALDLLIQWQQLGIMPVELRQSMEQRFLGAVAMLDAEFAFSS